MNTASPLSKDQRKKKDAGEKTDKPKPKPKISLATAKKILKPSKRIIGEAETYWLNNYIENRVRGECLPLNLWSNDIVSEIHKTFGGSSSFIDSVLRDFESQMPSMINPVSTSEHDSQK